MFATIFCYFLFLTYAQPYVFTAPSSTTAVHDEDKIYVLSKEVPIKDLL